MKFLYTLFLSIFFTSVYSQYNLAIEADGDAGKLNVILKVSFDAAGTLGASDLVFDFDEALLTNPILLSTPLSDAPYEYASLEVNVSTKDGGTNDVLTFTALPNIFLANPTLYPIPADAGSEVLVAIVQFDKTDAEVTTDLTWRVAANDSETVVRDGTTQLAQGLLSNAEGVSLPIELSAFNATKKGQSALLNWTTSSEINGSHFDVERSLNGSDWSVIGQVEARGESTSLVNYTLTDNDIPVLINATTMTYYRLNMVDNDGSAAYSDVRTLEFEGRNEVISIHPNPTANYINVSSEFEVSEVKILDINGKLILDQKYNNGVIDLSDLKSGMYKVIVSTEAGDHVKSLVKID